MPWVKYNFPNLTSKEWAKKLGQMWKALEEEDRAPYRMIAFKDKMIMKQHEEMLAKDKLVAPKRKKLQKKKGMLIEEL